MGETERAIEGYEEARADLAKRLTASPQDGRILTTLGIVCAKLGRYEEAVRYGELGVAFDGPERDAFTGPNRLSDLTAIYSLVGDSEKALERMRELLEIPGPFSVPIIEADPDFESLRKLPRYQALMDSHR